MRYDQIVRAKGGTDRHIEHVNEIKIHDMWHTAQAIRDKKPLNEKDAEMILETWCLCHDLLDHVKRVCKEPHTP